MFYREAGQFKANYREDQQIFPIRQDRIAIALLLAFFFLVVPVIADEYWLKAILVPTLIFALAAIGLNILTGYAGQLSLGSAAFMAVGAFAAYNFMLRVPGMPILAAMALGGLTAARCRRAVRAALAAHQGLLSGGGHPGSAILHRLAADQGALVLELQFLRRDHRPAGEDPRLCFRNAGEQVPACPGDRDGSGAGRQEHGAQLDRPRVDGGARHGCGGGGDRHPPACTPS